MKWPTEKTRAYIYRILLALSSLVLIYGWLSADQLAAWLGVAGVALNVMPVSNTKT
jgi:hypothetical protein